MAHFASILYAPLILISLRYFNIEHIAFVVIVLSLVWFYRVRKEGVRVFLLPCFYFCGAVLALFVQNEVVLKAIPLFIALSFVLFFLPSGGGDGSCAMACWFQSLSSK